MLARNLQSGGNGYNDAPIHTHDRVQHVEALTLARARRPVRPPRLAPPPALRLGGAPC
jgi:hypothetical protein